jgi:hypothetical protein
MPARTPAVLVSWDPAWGDLSGESTGGEPIRSLDGVVSADSARRDLSEKSPFFVRSRSPSGQSSSCFAR